jgi:hypothetical protein
MEGGTRGKEGALILDPEIRLYAVQLRAVDIEPPRARLEMQICGGKLPVGCHSRRIDRYLTVFDQHTGGNITVEKLLHRHPRGR